MTIETRNPATIHRSRILASLIVSSLTALVVSALTVPPLAAQPPSQLVIRDVTVIPMTGEEPADPQTVVVKNGQITKIGPDVKAPKKAQILDGSGKFLIPGLIDAHVHLSRPSDGPRRLLDLFLHYGVTSVINLEGTKNVLAVRDQIAAGEAIGPTIVTAGAILYGSSTTTEAQARRLVQMQADSGYDLIKVYNPLSAEGYRGVMDEAKKLGIPVIGHAVRAVGLEGALDSGQHLAHIEEVVYGYFTWKSGERGDLPTDVVERLDVLLDESKIPELAQRVKDAGIWVTPNLVAYHGIIEQLTDLAAVLSQPEVAWMPQSMQASWQPEKNDYTNRDNPESFRRAVVRTYPFLEKLTLAFHEAGVPLLAGTDVGIPSVIAGDSLHRELELLVDAGLSPQAALETATRSAAELFGRDELGRIEIGAQADLVLLSADPREDISNTRRIESVIVRGQLFDREAFASSLP